MFDLNVLGGIVYVLNRVLSPLIITDYLYIRVVVTAVLLLTSKNISPLVSNFLGVILKGVHDITFFILGFKISFPFDHLGVLPFTDVIFMGEPEFG